jgi:thioredoxin 1
MVPLATYMAVLKGTQETFKADVLDYEGVAFVDFYADWCGPCKMTSPLIEELSEDESYKDVRFMKVDVDANQQLAVQYNVFSIPTFIAFKNGEIVSQFAGARDRSAFKETLDRALQASPEPSEDSVLK